MSETRKLAYWLLSIFSATFILVACVVAHDRQIDQCIVDHLLDFHFDADHAREEAEKNQFKRDVQERMDKLSEERQRQWADEVRDWGNDAHENEGTISGNDSNDCNRDR